ncbi:MAG: hypothetical protein QMC60_01035 [Amylibacter sp.]|jgi:hypothetical protein|tara:strand:- start:159 stop:581 length:423 start_codon:yes stop_codon:yes gene_type:complete
MFEVSQLSKFFWFTMSISYAFCFSALYTYSTIPEYTLELNNTAQINITMKLATVRLIIVATALFAYPIFLFRFFKYAKYFTVALTAWAVAIYIDDIFVLSEIIKYPESGLISSIQSFRPILIASLLWMSIELIFRPLTVD